MPKHLLSPALQIGVSQRSCEWDGPDHKIVRDDSLDDTNLCRRGNCVNRSEEKAFRAGCVPGGVRSHPVYQRPPKIQADPSPMFPVVKEDDPQIMKDFASMARIMGGKPLVVDRDL